MSETTGSMGRGVRFFRSTGRAFAPALWACLGLACSEHAGQADGVAASPAETNGTNATSVTARAGAAFGAAKAVREKGAFAASRGGAKARVAEARAGRATARAGASAAGAGLDVERYDLAGTFDWSQNRLFASVTVTLGAASAPPARVVLDSRVSAVTGVSLPSGEALAFEVDADAGTLAVELGARATPGVSFVIDYEASTPYGSGLFGSTPLAMYPEREGDPNPARVVYTFSEPELARDWLPSHDDPSDGAFFSVDLHVGYGERLIANGDLVADSTGCGQEGRMKYATAYPLPTYLMAFALGEFEVEEKTGPHGLPLSVWHRPGLQGDYQQTLSDIGRLVKRYERLTGVPYPYEKYALVLVPDFFGGEENVSISFQAEADSNQPEFLGDNVLTAHELAHQWFGDLVTVETWNDLWIKEGMASLLEREGTRARLDRDGKGLADGDARRVAAGEAVRDLSLPAEQKYTSGPYDRAAWLLAQMRHLAGEDAFWGTLRQVLNEHRFGSIGTDAFLEAFRPALGDATLGRVRQALDAQGLPALAVEALSSGGARVTLSDPEGALLAPMRVAWHRAGGAIETVDLPIGLPVDLVRQAPGDLLVIDPLDLHPAWTNFLADEASGEAYFTALSPLRRPATGQTKRFLGVGGAHQLAALSEGPLPAMPARDFDDFLRKLDSDSARATAVARACEVAVSEGGAWKHVVRNVLRRQPFTFGLNEAPRVYGACAAFAPANELFPGAWQALALGLTKPVLSELETEYMLKLPASPAETLRAWAPVAAHGYSTRVRSQGATALAIIASQPGLISDAELPAWRAKAGELVASSTVPDVVFPLIFLAGQTAGPTAADNAAALAGLGEVLRTPMLSVTHPFAGCTAYGLTQGDEAAWQAFAASLEGAELSELIAFFLLNPAAFCG
ncbi:MAG: aminopeptidase [Polyangiaceae bacterium]|nr:aminopeptidase [Polyangiaceae bacterium]